MKQKKRRGPKRPDPKNVNCLMHVHTTFIKLQFDSGDLLLFSLWDPEENRLLIQQMNVQGPDGWIQIFANIQTISPQDDVYDTEFSGILVGSDSWITREKAAELRAERERLAASGQLDEEEET